MGVAPGRAPSASLPPPVADPRLRPARHEVHLLLPGPRPPRCGADLAFLFKMLMVAISCVFGLFHARFSFAC